ncbi:hypothetical protein BSR28_08610 [Boudabousia liubingyangii]|nr:hypothetical protein BSR28_08610 [Boudabousia liubingyangii]
MAQPSADWETACLDDLFDVRIGRTPPRKETEWFAQPSASSIAWASIKDMGAVRTYISHTEQALTEDAVKSFRINVAKIGDVLVSFKLTVGRVAIVGREMCTNEAIACIHSEDPLLSEWLYCFLKSFDYSSLGNTSSIGTAVNSKTIKAVRMPMPPGDLLKRFHEFSAPLLQISQRHEKQVSTLTELRDALLPELMSGRMRADELKGLVTSVLEANS